MNLIIYALANQQVCLSMANIRVLNETVNWFVVDKFLVPRGTEGH